MRSTAHTRGLTNPFRVTAAQLHVASSGKAKQAGAPDKRALAHKSTETAVKQSLRASQCLLDTGPQGKPNR